VALTGRASKRDFSFPLLLLPRVGRHGQVRYLAVILFVVFALDGAASP
jgi:hypothetical protein